MKLGAFVPVHTGGTVNFLLIAVPLIRLKLPLSLLTGELYLLVSYSTSMKYSFHPFTPRLCLILWRSVFLGVNKKKDPVFYVSLLVN